MNLENNWTEKIKAHKSILKSITCCIGFCAFLALWIGLSFVLVPINYSVNEHYVCNENVVPQEQIGIGISVLDIGAEDLKEGTFEGDFLIYMVRNPTPTWINANVSLYQAAYAHFDKSFIDSLKAAAANDENIERPSVCPNLTAENSVEFDKYDLAIMNAKEVTRKSYGKSLRVRGTFFFTPQYLYYPFDEQEIPIQIEFAKLSYRDAIFCFMVEYSNLDPELTFRGQTEHIQEFDWRVKMGLKPHPYTEKYTKTDQMRYGVRKDIYYRGERCFSRFSLGIKAKRDASGAFFERMFPLVVVTIITLSTYFIREGEVSTRIGICGSMLLTAVFFSVSQSQLPMTGELTIDRVFQLSVFFIIGVAFVFSAALMYLYTMDYKKAFSHLSEYSFAPGLASIFMFVSTLAPGSFLFVFTLYHVLFGMVFVTIAHVFIKYLIQKLKKYYVDKKNDNDDETKESYSVELSKQEKNMFPPQKASPTNRSSRVYQLDELKE